MFQSLIHPDDAIETEQAIANHLERNCDFSIRFRLKSKDGTFRWFCSRGLATRNADGQPTTMTGTLSGVDPLIAGERSSAHQYGVSCSDRTTSEGRAASVSAIQSAVDIVGLTVEQVRSELKRFYDLYDCAPDMHATVCPVTRRILQCNQTLADQLGYTKAEVIGCDLMKFYHADCRHGAQIGFTSFVGNKEVRETELQLKRKDGSALDVSLKVSAVRDEQGKVLFSRSAWRDISQQKQLERQLRLREEELAHYNRISALGEIASELAHELNQPLGAITNYLGGCKAKLASGKFAVEEMAQVAAKAEREAYRASKIVKRLRRIAKKQPTQVEIVDIHAAIRESCTLLHESLQKENIQLRLEFCETVPAIAADTIQIEQVIVNLLSNAIRALQDEDQPRQITISTVNQGNKFSVCVSDNGRGIQEDHEAVFLPFRSSSAEGLGLGLSICRTIIRSFGGTIFVKSDLPDQPKGACFCILLPVDESSARAGI
jgi:PAS domain S-box-containing protein